jgi:hypothetical protein
MDWKLWSSNIFFIVCWLFQAFLTVTESLLVHPMENFLLYPGFFVYKEKLGPV